MEVNYKRKMMKYLWKPKEPLEDNQLKEPFKKKKKVKLIKHLFISLSIYHKLTHFLPLISPFE